MSKKKSKLFMYYLPIRTFGINTQLIAIINLFFAFINIYLIGKKNFLNKNNKLGRRKNYYYYYSFKYN